MVKKAQPSPDGTQFALVTVTSEYFRLPEENVLLLFSFGKIILEVPASKERFSVLVMFHLSLTVMWEDPKTRDLFFSPEVTNE